MSSQLESLFLNPAASRSEASSPSLILAMYLEWHIRKTGRHYVRLHWKLSLLKYMLVLICIKHFMQMRPHLYIKLKDSQKVHITGEDLGHLTGEDLIPPHSTWPTDTVNSQMITQ